MKKTKNTSWGKVAGWYDAVVEQKDSYQKDLILPNIIRLLNPQKGDLVADIACGQGLFSRAVNTRGARVIASDISPELIAIAKKNGGVGIEYHISSADNQSFIKDASADGVLIVLALQNIKNIDKVFAEVKRILKKDGRILIVLNHPAFRIPKTSLWGWDDETKTQYRRIDAYLSESENSIDMHPGTKGGPKTVSFHRPLQFYIKMLAKNGLCVSRLEEWTSHKKSEHGLRAKAEDIARHEIPLFLFLEAKKL